MTTIPQVAHTMQVILQETAQQIGRASGFVQRQSPLGGAELAQTLVFGWLTNPQATLEELAQTAATVGVSISAQDLDQRLGQRAADCMQQVLRQGAQQMLRAETVPLSVWEHFTGVYVQDSTTVNLPADLADVWPGCGGAENPSAMGIAGRAAPRVGRGVASRPDRRPDGQCPAGPTAPGRPGLADLGYFSLERLAAQALAGSYWLTRVQAGTALVDAHGRPWTFSAWLATQAASQVDHPIHLGTQHQLPCRLLATRVTPAVAAARRRQLRAQARRRGQAVSAERLKLAGWTVFVTNVPTEWLTLDQAWVLARVRWQIELLFKLWKSHAQLDQWRSRKPWRILCEVYAKLLGQLVQHWILLLSCWDCPNRSLVKAARTIRHHALHLAGVFCQSAALQQALMGVQRCLAHGCRLNQRRGAPSTFQRLVAFDLAHA